MKKILTIAMVCAGLMSFTACNDFLDEELKSTLTNVGYYQTEAQALANVNYLYRTGAIDKMASAPSAYIGSFASVNQMLTGYFPNSYEGQEQVCKYARELTRQNFTMRIAGTVDGAWDDIYKAINVANAAIKHIPEIPMSDATKSQLITEAKFFRAFNKLRTQDDIDEVVYSREYDATVSNSSWFPTYAFNGTATAVFSTYSIFERVFGPTNQFLNVYATNDLRIQPNQFFHWEYTNPNTGVQWKSEDAAGCWYYYDEEALLNTGIGTKDFNVYRYAEALLNGAEAIAQSSGVTVEAAGYLAQVQARSNMEGKTVAQLTSELQSLSKEAFIQACQTERLREFPLEYKMWDDCVRTKKFPVISKTEKGKVQYVDLVGATNGSGATFKATDLVWPISVNEIQRNPSLEQNEGYSRQ